VLFRAAVSPIFYYNGLYSAVSRFQVKLEGFLFNGTFTSLYKIILLKTLCFDLTLSYKSLQQQQMHSSAVLYFTPN
jgi:hypothetical protein